MALLPPLAPLLDSTGERHCCFIVAGWARMGTDRLEPTTVRPAQDVQHSILRHFAVPACHGPGISHHQQRGKDGTAIHKYSQHCGHRKSSASAQYANSIDEEQRQRNTSARFDNDDVVFRNECSFRLFSRRWHLRRLPCEKKVAGGQRMMH